MKIQDRIYGEVEIKDQVILDLIESKAITRLGKINQYGAIYQLYPQFFTTRREHSIGVMILLKKLGASIEEQIAGLIHDVPHTAFSHVIDYVFGDEKMETSYHETIQKETYQKSDIPAFLDKYNLDKDLIFDVHNFSLLERDLPDLCADRVDYILRDLLTYDLFSKKEIYFILENLISYEGEIILKDEEAAFLLATKSIEANEKIWSSPYQILLAKTLADIIKLALDRKYIERSDLHGTDNRLYRKLTSIEDKDIKDLLKLMTKKIVVVSNEEDYQMHVYTKLRIINPKILKDDKVYKLSDLNKEYCKLREDYIKKHEKGFKLNIRERKVGEIIN